MDISSAIQIIVTEIGLKKLIAYGWILQIEPMTFWDLNVIWLLGMSWVLAISYSIWVLQNS